MSFPIALCCPHPAQSRTHTVPFIAFFLKSEGRETPSWHSQWHECVPSSKRTDTSEIRKPPLRCTGRKQILRVYRGRESTQEWQDVQSSHMAKEWGHVPECASKNPRRKSYRKTRWKGWEFLGYGNAAAALGQPHRGPSCAQGPAVVTRKMTKMPVTGTQRVTGRTFPSVPLCQKSTGLLQEGGEEAAALGTACSLRRGGWH